MTNRGEKMTKIVKITALNIKRILVRMAIKKMNFVQIINRRLFTRNIEVLRLN